MISKRWLRYILGAVLGGAAGLSLTSTILPLALSVAGLKEEFLVRWDLGGYAAHCVLAFAFGGWLIARFGSSRLGPLLLGGVGLLCGAALGLTVYPGELEWTAFMAVAAGAYGSIGGLLLGLVLQQPAGGDAAGK
jgi:MFS family permease